MQTTDRPTRARWVARAVPAVFFALVAILCGPPAAAETVNLERSRDRALVLVNKARTGQGLPPLAQEGALNSAAQAHAEDMLARDYYAHSSPEGDTVADRYAAAGGSRWRLTAENIARCRGCPTPPSPERVERLHEGWMNSPPHRENILRRGLDGFGFGIAAGADNTVYAVQTFAGPGLPRDLQAGEEARAIGQDEQIAVALERINKERRANGRQPLSAAAALSVAASNLIPDESLDKASLALQSGLRGALPRDAVGQWESLGALAAQCGGCGTDATSADVRSFVTQWLEDPGYRQRLLAPELSHLGFLVRANGSGLKKAVAVLGHRR